MNLRQFLDAAYAIYIEELLRLGAPLEQALEMMSKWAVGGDEEDPIAVQMAQNDESLQQLQQMMSGVR